MKIIIVFLAGFGLATLWWQALLDVNGGYLSDAWKATNRCVDNGGDYEKCQWKYMMSMPE